MLRELTKQENMSLGFDNEHPAQAYSKHYFDTELNRFVTEIYQYPVRYRDAENTWQDIDTTIENEVGFGHKVKKAAHNIRFFENPGQTLRFGFDKGVYVDYSLPGSPVFDGLDTATINIDANTDLIYKSLPEGIKADFILKTAEAQSVFSFPVSLNAVTAMAKNNNLIFTEILTGKVVGRIKAPHAIDTNGVHGRVVLSYDGNAITFTVDSEFSANAVFPVTIDPTTTIQPDPAAGIDSYVDGTNTATNYGTNVSLYSGKGPGGAYTPYRALLKFDVSSIPAGSVVSSAVFSLYCNYAYVTTSYQFDLHEITANWAEGTVTWANQPAYDASAAGSTNVSVIGAWYSWTITTLVAEWIAGTTANYGLIIKNNNEGTAETEKHFHSSDYVVDTSLRPKLVITYNAPPTIGLTTPTGTELSPTTVNNDVTPTYQGTYSDLESDAIAYSRWQTYDEDDNVIDDTGKVVAATYNYTVPSGKLIYGVKYWCRWKAWDSAGAESDWSVVGWFMCQMTAPAGFTATADITNAHIDLAWTAHTGEGLAGYNIYRRVTGTSTYIKQNSSIISTNSYIDSYVGSGISYDYYVVAVSTTGYEGAASATDTESVTFSNFWLGTFELTCVTEFDLQLPRKQSSQDVWGKDYPVVQNYGTGGNRINMTILIRTKATYDSFVTAWESDEQMGLRDLFGRAWKVVPIGPLTVKQIKGTGQVDYWVMFTVQEVAA